MDLYILRHGIAAPHGGYADDSERPLTKEGIEEMKEIAKAMQKLKIDFEAVYSSPYVRARETAEIVVKKLEIEKRLTIKNQLKAEADPQILIDEIRAMKDWPASLLLVGHEPYLSSLIAVLTSGNINMLITLKKGGFCKMDVVEPRYGRCASLEWLMTPKQMVKIAAS